MLAAGCTPDAATTNKRAPEDRFSPTVVLEGQNAHRAVEGMRTPTAGHEARPLVPAPHGVRWEDSETAIRNVAEAQFFGVLRVDSKDGHLVATIICTDGQRGTFTATRVADGVVRGEARIGVFPSERVDSAFERAFDAELLRLGRIPRPQP